MFTVKAIWEYDSKREKEFKNISCLRLRLLILVVLCGASYLKTFHVYG